MMDKAKIARSGCPSLRCLSTTARRSPSLDPRRAVTFYQNEQRTTHRRAGGSLRIGARGCDASSLARCKTGRLTMGGLGCFSVVHSAGRFGVRSLFLFDNLRTQRRRQAFADVLPSHFQNLRAFADQKPSEGIHGHVPDNGADAPENYGALHVGNR